MSSFQVKLNYEDSQEPTRGSDEAAGYDLYSYESETVVPKQIKLIDTGISIRVPEGTYGRIAPRSSVSKKDLILANSVGVLDSGYRGELKIRFQKMGEEIYEIGERIAQILVLPIPEIEFEEVENLSESVRGEGGFGSTGLK